MELQTARIIAESIVEKLSPSCTRATIAGSVRREKPNVKDIEIVAIVSDYDMMYDVLSKYGQFIKPGVPDVIPWPPKHGAKYVRMMLMSGIKLDLFIANPDNWGSLLFMRTGPAADAKGNTFNGFVPKAFSRWKKLSKGGRMTNCQPTMPDGTILAVPEERDFFELLGIEWVEPCDRIDGKSVKAL